MKIGDKVRHTKIRPTDIATIVRFEFVKIFNEQTGKTENRTKYTAQFDDTSVFIFYGFNIGKTVFPIETTQQLSFDFTSQDLQAL